MTTFQVIIAALCFGISYGSVSGVFKFTSDVKIKELNSKFVKWKAEAMEWKHEYNVAITKWNKLVAKINAKGGEKFLDCAIIPSDEMQRLLSPSFTKDEIKTMISLCHPDKHGGSKTAEDVTRKLLAMRK